MFGTVVDWRTSVTRYLEDKSLETLNSAASSIGMPTRLACAAVNWGTFALEWRTGYYEFTRAQAKHKDDGPIAFKTVDDHHLDSLRFLLAQHEIGQLWSEEEVVAISRVWHFLDGWPDSCRGLQALKDREFVVRSLSNGNLSLLEDMADFANLPWTHVFSAERFGAYKPHPSVYDGACKELALKPGECAMVAAHLGDLEAANGCGLQTIYVEREGEESWPAEKVREAKSKGWVDMWVGLDQNSAGGGILEVVRRMEIGQVK